jgi:regulator of sigma E protease
MLGGTIMNVFLGIFIYWMLLFFRGEEYIPTANVKYGIAVDSVGWEMGFQNGDKIVAVDGQPVENFSRIPSAIILNMAKKVTVERNGQQVDIPIDQSMIKKAIDTKTIDFVSIRMPFVIKAFSPGSAAKDAGLQVNDQVIAINNQPAYYYDEVRKQLFANKGAEVEVRFLRSNDTLSKKVKLTSEGMLGVQAALPDEFMQSKVIRYTFLGALPAGMRKAYETLTNYIKQFSLIFSSKVQGYKHVGGFISIANAFEPKWDWISFWSFTGFLSIALAFMNLLPIPALDGGHVIFTLYEMVTRRKPNEKFLEYAQIAGMIILLTLMVYANGSDIVGLFR